MRKAVMLSCALLISSIFFSGVGVFADDLTLVSAAPNPAVASPTGHFVFNYTVKNTGAGVLDLSVILEMQCSVARNTQNCFDVGPQFLDPGETTTLDAHGKLIDPTSNGTVRIFSADPIDEEVAITPHGAGIPTLSYWGMLVLMLGLTCAGLLLLRRRSSATAG